VVGSPCRAKRGSLECPGCPKPSRTPRLTAVGPLVAGFAVPTNSNAASRRARHRRSTRLTTYGASLVSRIRTWPRLVDLSNISPRGCANQISHMHCRPTRVKCKPKSFDDTRVNSLRQSSLKTSGHTRPTARRPKSESGLWRQEGRRLVGSHGRPGIAGIADTCTISSTV